MSKQYYVWKNPACGGIHVEWQELTGREFYAMVKRQENRQRRFIHLTNDICEDADIIIIEATELQYQQWRKEQNAHDYLARQEAGCVFLSLDAPEDECECGSLYDAIADERTNIERNVQDAFDLEQLTQAMQALTDEERYLICAFFGGKKTTIALAKELGVRQCTVSRRISAAIRKTKKFF